MIVSSFNVRGLGGSLKKNKIKELIRNHGVDFMAIQETKLENVSPALSYKLWGSQNCNWAFLPSEGNSGGILSLWNNTISKLIFSFSGDGFVGVCLEWGVLATRCFVVNIYSKCDLVAKRRLWDNLVEVKEGLGDGVWWEILMR